jgi:hypothetical protein
MAAQIGQGSAASHGNEISETFQETACLFGHVV